MRRVAAPTCRALVVAGMVLTLAEGTPARAGEPAVAGIEAVGTAFRVTLADGSVKQGRELAGAVLVFDIGGAPIRIRIASIVPDPDDTSGAVLLHDFRLEESGAPLCNAAPDGTRLGFPLVGRTAADGRFVAAEPSVFELACTAGSQGKCVRFGYRPWEMAPDGRPMLDEYNACIRMLRADYCGDGHGWTRDGTLIDLWDDRGIQTPGTAGDPSFSFEAGWTADGAVCVAHSRIPENVTRESLLAYCPRLARLSSCDEGTARAAGALLFNRSR